MKLQCDLCREIVAADFTVGSAGIEVSCPACGGHFTVAATRVTTAARPRPRTSTAPPDGPTMTCPKCSEVQRVAPACRACGLLQARMDDFARDQEAQVPDVVRAAWAACEARWSDDAAHERLVSAVAATTSYPWAARRYREALRLRPDDATAAAQIERLARMAEATLRASATTRKDTARKPYRGVIAVLVVLVAVAAAGAIYAVATGAGDHGSGRRTPATRAAPPLHAAPRPP